MKRIVVMVALLVGACGDDAAWHVADYDWSVSVMGCSAAMQALEVSFGGEPPTDTWLGIDPDQWTVESYTAGEEAVVVSGETRISWMRDDPTAGFPNPNTIRLTGEMQIGDECTASVTWTGVER